MEVENKHSLDKFVYRICRQMHLKLVFLCSHPYAKRSELIELIRFLSESLVWSEQNNSNLFNYFIEKNMQLVFYSILHNEKSKETTIQLIQSANILIHNLSGFSSKKYLVDSKFFSLLAALDFDTSDDELLENYTSFLKGLAANLPQSLLLDYVTKTNFCIFVQAFKFFDSGDSMIKNASRTVVLTIIKRKNYLVGTASVFEFLCAFEFSFKVMTSVVKMWNRLYEEVPSDNKLLVENFVSVVSDDLCYVNDLLEHVDEINRDLCDKFLSLSMPWIIKSLNFYFDCNTNFIPAGFIIFCIFEYIKSEYILNILSTSLFSPKISEKMFYFVTTGSIPNNQFDFLEEEQGSIDNIVKHQFTALLNQPETCTIALLILNNTISNPFISKKVLFECQLLPKDEIKKQKLVRMILQDSQEYNSDKILAELLLKTISTFTPQFNIFLASKIIIFCSLHPEELYIPQLKENITKEILSCLNEIKKHLEKEKLKDILLDVFEDQATSIKTMKFEDKVNFPSVLLSHINSITPGFYRLPLSKFEIYNWHFYKLLILKRLYTLLFSNTLSNVSEINLPCMSFDGPTVTLQCLNDLTLVIQDFYLQFLYKAGQSKTYKLRCVEVMADNKHENILNITVNQNKNSITIQAVFENSQICKETKKNIENQRKESKTKEFMLIQNFIQQEETNFAI